MMEENGSKVEGSPGSDISISSRVDPTSVMPVFDQGKAVDSMSVEEAQKEWREMTVSDEKFKDFPRSVFLNRRDALWKLGFEEKIKQNQKAEEEKNRGWLEGENEKIEERDAREVEGKLEERLVKHFGSEEEANKKVRSAQSLVKKYVTNPKDLQFLDESLLGNDFEVIGIVARLNEILEGARSKMKLQRKSKKETTELTRGGK
jgi:hypothetical protein